MRSQVQVGVCLRPLIEKEKDSGAKIAVEIIGKHLCFNNSTNSAGYDFENLFRPTSSQTRCIYDTMISPLIDHFFQGFTATVFAYGQTGSGKTYLMGSNLTSSSNSRLPSPRDLLESSQLLSSTGEVDQDDNLSTGGDSSIVSLSQNTGIIPLSLDDIFKKKAQLQAEGASVLLEMSYLEIYQEECYDLLLTVHSREGNKENSKRGNNDKNKSVSLEMRENAKGETILEGLSSWPVNDQSDFHKLLSAAARSRATGKTAMNSRSSRSHAIATLSLRITMDRDKNSSIFSPTRGSSTTIVTSKLHLVDLAGSERVGKTLASGECLREGVSINKGLLTLGKVVSALNEQQSQSITSKSNTHVPYRESKLTRLLKDALGGNGMTVMLACCSPADSQFKETLDTLRFATRASAIVNNAKQNMNEIVADLPPFVCYSCGAQNPCGRDLEQAFLSTSPKGIKRGRDGDILNLDHVEVDLNGDLVPFDEDDENEDDDEEDDHEDDESEDGDAQTEEEAGTVHTGSSVTEEDDNDCAIGSDNEQDGNILGVEAVSGKSSTNPFGSAEGNVTSSSNPFDLSGEKENRNSNLPPSSPTPRFSPSGSQKGSPVPPPVYYTFVPPTGRPYVPSPYRNVYRLSPTPPPKSSQIPTALSPPLPVSSRSSPMPKMLTTSALLATLDARTTEIFMLQKKLQKSETDRLEAEDRLKSLQTRFISSQTDNEEKMKKKRKTIIQRVRAAVSCHVDQKSVYSPQGKSGRA